MKLKFACLVVALAVSLSAQAFEPVLSTQTDDSTKYGWALPSTSVARAIFGSLDTDLKSLLRDYFKEHGEIKNKRIILAERRVAICTTCSGKYAFVRTSGEYFSPLAGVHTFFYWIVDNRGQILLGSGADRVDIVATNKSFVSINETNCTAVKCYKKRYDFDGRRYVPGECQEFNMDGRNLGRCRTD